MSARKARLVMDMVRGTNAHAAMTMLKFVNRRAAPEIGKLIHSAVANAEEYANRSGIAVATEELVIFDLRADQGPQMKRWRPRSRGMANPFTRYTCHMTATLAEAKYVEERAKGRPAFARPRRRLSKEQRLAKKGIIVESPKAAAAEAETKPKAEADKKPAAKPAAKAKSGKPKGKPAAKAKGGKSESKKKPGKK
jgi:large subunit ribosomal protein L22